MEVFEFSRIELAEALKQYARDIRDAQTAFGETHSDMLVADWDFSKWDAGYTLPVAKS